MNYRIMILLCIGVASLQAMENTAEVRLNIWEVPSFIKNGEQFQIDLEKADRAHDTHALLNTQQKIYFQERKWEREKLETINLRVGVTLGLVVGSFVSIQYLKNICG